MTKFAKVELATNRIVGIYDAIPVLARAEWPHFEMRPMPDDAGYGVGDRIPTTWRDRANTTLMGRPLDRKPPPEPA